METFKGLLKVGKKEHLEALRNGIVYFNTLQYFKQLEAKDNGMKDRFECGQSVFQFTELSVKVNDRYTPVLKDGFAVFDNGRYRGNVFCTYFINIPVDEISSVDQYPLNIESPIASTDIDSFMIISNIEELTRRMERKVADEGERLFYGPVDYLEFASYAGELTPFNKDVRFKHQKEWRYYIGRTANSKADARRYDLGDLSDITSEVMDINSISTLTFFRKNIPTT